LKKGGKKALLGRKIKGANTGEKKRKLVKGGSVVTIVKIRQEGKPGGRGARGPGVHKGGQASQAFVTGEWGRWEKN